MSDLDWAYLCAVCSCQLAKQCQASWRLSLEITCHFPYIAWVRARPVQPGSKGVVKLALSLMNETAEYCGALCIYYIVILRTHLFGKYWLQVMPCARYAAFALSGERRTHLTWITSTLWMCGECLMFVEGGTEPAPPRPLLPTTLISFAITPRHDMPHGVSKSCRCDSCESKGGCVFFFPLRWTNNLLSCHGV